MKAKNKELPGVRSISGVIQNVWKTGRQRSILILVLPSRVYREHSVEGIPTENANYIGM